jgi:hypothetical protein
MSQKRYYKIRELPGFENLIAAGESLQPIDGSDSADPVYDYLAVTELINVHVTIGDRLLRYPIPTGAMFISADHLEQIQDPEIRQFTFTSPFGKYLFDGEYIKGNLRVKYVRYDNAVSITITEKFDGGKAGRTLYSQNFFKKAAQALVQIEYVLAGTADVDDLKFNLEQLKSEDN